MLRSDNQRKIKPTGSNHKTHCKSWAILILLGLLLFNSRLQGQNSPLQDSLRQILKTELTDSARIVVMDKLSISYLSSSLDSSMSIISRALINEPQGASLEPHIIGLLHWSYFLMQPKVKQYELAAEKADEALELSYSHPDKTLERKANYQLGTVYAFAGKPAKSIEYKKRILEILQEQGEEPDLMVETMTNLINSLFRNNQPDEAYELLMNVKPYLDSTLLDENRVLIYDKLRFFHRYRKEWEPTLYYSEKYYELSKKNNQVDKQIVALNSMARMNIRLNRPETANENFKLAMSLLEAHDIDEMRLEDLAFEIMGRKGNLNLQQGELDEALSTFKTRLSLARKKNLSFQIAYSQMLLGDAYVRLGKLEQAKVYFRKSYVVYEKILNDPKNSLSLHEKYMSYNRLSIADTLLGNHKSSIDNYQKLMLYEDSVRQSKMLERMNEIDVKYSAAQKDNEIALLKAQNDLKVMNAAQNSRFLKFSAIAVVILLALSVLLYYRFVEKHKDLEIISKKKGENEMLVKEIHHRVKNNLQIMLSLLNIQSGMIENGQAKRMVSESKNRIISMALIHQNLYQSGNMVMVETGSYFEDLVKSITQSLETDKKNIRFKTNIKSDQIGLKLAVPIGLILNELITNCIKHTLKDSQNGELTIDFEKNEENELYHLRVMDNGAEKGGTSYVKNRDVFGLTLVQGLTDQINGYMEIGEGASTCFDIYVTEKDVA